MVKNCFPVENGHLGCLLNKIKGKYSCFSWLCALAARTTPLSVIISMGESNRNLEISMGKVTLKLLISPKISIVQVQTGRTLFSSWRLPCELNVVKIVIANNLLHAKKWPWKANIYVYHDHVRLQRTNLPFRYHLDVQKSTEILKSQCEKSPWSCHFHPKST